MLMAMTGWSPSAFLQLIAVVMDPAFAVPELQHRPLRRPPRASTDAPGARLIAGNLDEFLDDLARLRAAPP
jgi:hypothetical protein